MRFKVSENGGVSFVFRKRVRSLIVDSRKESKYWLVRAFTILISLAFFRLYLDVSVTVVGTRYDN